MITVVVIIAVIILIFGLVVLRGAPYVPSHGREVKKAFRELYPLNSHDVLVDVGSGDGIILRLAAKEGARAIGYELNPFLVIISWLLAGRNRRITTELVDFWLKQLPPETTIVYAFSISRDVDKLSDKLQRETNRIMRPVHLMTYGASLRHKKSIKKRRGHHLYKFVPLQEEKA